MIVAVDEQRDFIDPVGAKKYQEKFKKRLETYIPDYSERKRRVFPKPEKEVKVPLDVLKEVEEFFDTTFDGRRLEYEKVDFRIGNGELHFFVENVFKDIIAVDIFVEKKLKANMIFENDEVTKDVLDSKRWAHMAFCIIRENDPINEVILQNILYDLSCITWYRMIFGDDFYALRAGNPEEKLKEFFKENKYFKPEHRTPSGRKVKGHFTSRR